MQGASAAEDKLPAAKDAAKAADPTQTSTEESVQAHEDAAAAVESRRPDGVSKIDLRDVWGGRTPASSPEGAAGKTLCFKIACPYCPHGRCKLSQVSTDKLGACLSELLNTVFSPVGLLMMVLK